MKEYYLLLGNKKIKIKKASKFLQRLIGLIGKKEFNYGLLFNNCNSIHTFFMRTEIDIIAFDNDNKIIYFKSKVPKNKILKIKNNLKDTSIIELPSNTIKNLNIGDKLTFKSK
ncbi:MAG: DUF192 domain-containing protein [Mollicutes bacterium]|nr:DUF192 domain-containing protein [Mollicutes bacterium]